MNNEVVSIWGKMTACSDAFGSGTSDAWLSRWMLFYLLVLPTCFFFSVAFEVQVMIDFERFLVCVTFKRWSSCDLIKTHCFFFCKIDFIYYSLSFELFSVLFCSKSISSYQFMEAFCLLRTYYWVIFKYLRQLCVYF